MADLGAGANFRNAGLEVCHFGREIADEFPQVTRRGRAGRRDRIVRSPWMILCGWPGETRSGPTT